MTNQESSQSNKAPDERGAIDLSRITTDIDENRQEHDHGDVNPTVLEGLRVARNLFNSSEELPVSQRIIAPASQETNATENQESSESYKEAIAEYCLSQIKSGKIDRDDNLMLLGLLGEEHTTRVTKFLRKPDTLEQDDGHKKLNRKSRIIHGLSNSAAALAVFGVVHETGSNFLVSTAVAAGAGALGATTKTHAARKDEYAVISDPGDTQNQTDGSSAHKRDRSIMNVKSAEAKQASVFSDVLDDLEILGFHHEETLDAESVKQGAKRYEAATNRSSRGIRDQEAYQESRTVLHDTITETIEAANGQLSRDELTKLKVKTAIDLLDMESRNAEKKRFERWQLTKRGKGFMAAFAVAALVMIPANNKHEDAERKEQQKIEQETPFAPSEIGDRDQNTPDEQQQIEEDFNDQLGN